MNKKPTKSALSHFSVAFSRMLRPVTRILLRHGISFREMAELCKKVYVDVATDEFGVDGRPTNVSQVALLTGMTRRDVRKVQLSENEERQKSIGRMNICGRVLSGWYQDPEFCDDKGAPLALSKSSAFPSFTDLAKRYASDIPMTAIFKELKRSGAITVDANGELIVRSRNYMPADQNPAAPEAITRAGTVLEDIGNTIDWNLVRDPADSGRFERRATNINIAEEHIEEFHKFVNREGQAFLERVDTWLTQHEKPKETSTGKGVRLGLGVYWIQDSNH